MGNYDIRLKKSALKELLALPTTDAIRITTSIKKLASNPRPIGCKKLKGFKDLWRIRVGNFRVIYTIEDNLLIIEVLHVVNRKDAY